jgi:hypothetical protein
MPVSSSIASIRRVKARLRGVLANLQEDLKFAGENAAEAIVSTTLAGIGENDQPFAPYSPAYLATIDAVGGKPQQTVNLRGLFYHAGQKRVRFRNPERRRQYREGRRAYIAVGFTTKGGRSVAFTAKTGITRPAKGIIDPLSEMSLDLIFVTAWGSYLKLTYAPREKPYMIHHNEGTGRGPQRRWFTLEKTKVQQALLTTLREAIKARVAWFNSHNIGGLTYA